MRGAVAATIVAMYTVFYLSLKASRGTEALSALVAGLIVMLYVFYRRRRAQLSSLRTDHHP